MSKHLGLVALLSISLSILPFTGLFETRVYAQKTRKPPVGLQIVDVALDATLKETYNSSKDTTSETESGEAELTISHAYNGRMIMTPAPDGTASFDEVPNPPPGNMSGSFHFAGKEDSSTKGPDRLWTKTSMDVAGSLEPVGEVSFVRWSPGNALIVRVHTSSAGKLAACKTDGNTGHDPHECNLLNIGELSGHANGDCNASSCYAVDLEYELHPTIDKPKDANQEMDWADNNWYGSTTTGTNTTAFQVGFVGKKLLDRPGEEGNATKTTQVRTLTVSVRIAPGVRASIDPSNEPLQDVFAAAFSDDNLIAADERYGARRLMFLPDR